MLTVQNLKKIYGKKEKVVAVDGISFSLAAGEILGLLGPNGSGKTTTIQMLLGILTPTSGTITYFGKDLAKKRSEILQSVSFASTYTSLPFILTIEENLKIIERLYGIKDIFEEADPLLKRFGIFEKKKKHVSSLSAGQLTRLMIIKAFVTKPKVVLLDEPTASLDPDVALEVCAFIEEEREKKGVSILFTSHKMEEVATLCDRAIFLKKGNIIANDIPKNLAKKAALHRLKLRIDEGHEKAHALLQKSAFSYQKEKNFFEFSLEEKEIPPLLHALSNEKIAYSKIQIIEPSLEDFFFQIAKDPL